MGPYTSNQLSVFSAVLARSATVRDWSAGTEIKDDGPEIQEIQCMMLGETLYIGGNHSEHAAVGAFLNAYGVNDGPTFLKCLSYADWLLSMLHTTKKATTGVAYDCKYSAQEIKTLGLAGRPFTALTVEEITQACLLLKGTATGEFDQKLGWFLRKFVVAGPLTTKPYSKAKAKDGITFVTNALSASAVCVLKDTTDVHAELKLLAFMFDCVAADKGKWAHQAATVGGLKKTCNYCAKWIEHFGDMIGKRLTMTVALPTGDDRPLGSGAGKRPLSVHLDKMKGEYLKAMFNGELNSLCADLDRLKPT